MTDERRLTSPAQVPAYDERRLTSPAQVPAYDDHPIDPPPGWQRDHVERYVATGGADGHQWRGVHTLLLTTIGRRSGKARRTPLIYGRDGARYLIVASKDGSDDATAHTASPQEKARLWPAMTAIWPGCDEYQARTRWDIPLVVLTTTTPA